MAVHSPFTEFLTERDICLLLVVLLPPVVLLVVLLPPVVLLVVLLPSFVYLG